MGDLAVLLSVVLTMVGGASNQDDASKTVQSLHVSLNTPDSAWAVNIEQVYELNDELWVVARVGRGSEIGAAVITRVSDSIEIDSDRKRTFYFILGKTWNWQGREPYYYLDENELKGRLAGRTTKLIYSDLPSHPSAIKSDSEGDFVNVHVRGKLSTGLVAIGGETTGTTIRSGNITWELDFGDNRELQKKCKQLNQSTVTVTGKLACRPGIEIRRRCIVNVESLEGSPPSGGDQGQGQ